jgi:hypothetical protein
MHIKMMIRGMVQLNKLVCPGDGMDVFLGSGCAVAGSLICAWLMCSPETISAAHLCSCVSFTTFCCGVTEGESSSGDHLQGNRR